MNFSAPLGAGEQTNNRAELQAVIRVLESEQRAVDIRTDSKYVFDGALKNRYKWKRAGWRGKRRKLANADLWIALDALLEARPRGAVFFTKVKAHTTVDDVQRGLISRFDFEGNSAADALAVAGACVKDVDGNLRYRSRERIHIGLAVQRMMVEVLYARWSAGKGTEESSSPTENHGKSEVESGTSCCSGSDEDAESGTSCCSGGDVFANFSSDTEPD